ncbi:MAG: Gx transporter family protein [Spirochaetaceae bacterium]
MIESSRRDSSLELIAFLGAVSLFFSTIEYIIPKPIPFFRLGLANLPIIVTLPFFRVRHTLMLVLLKVLGQGLINGTLASYVFFFSLAGSLSSGLVMLLAHRLGGKRISLVGVSILGALASNVVQVLLSVHFIFGTTAWIIAPLFLTLGSGSGLAIGIFAQRFFNHSVWLVGVRREYTAPA